MGWLKIGTTGLTDYDNETLHVLLDLFLPVTEMSKVRATGTDACFLTKYYQVIREISRI
jgi:hypothetical protein